MYPEEERGWKDWNVLRFFGDIERIRNSRIARIGKLVDVNEAERLGSRPVGQAR